jgi:hypothetical protein
LPAAHQNTNQPQKKQKEPEEKPKDLLFSSSIKLAADKSIHNDEQQKKEQ